MEETATGYRIGIYHNKLFLVAVAVGSFLFVILGGFLFSKVANRFSMHTEIMIHEIFVLMLPALIASFLLKVRLKRSFAFKINSARLWSFCIIMFIGVFVLTFYLVPITETVFRETGKLQKTYDILLSAKTWQTYYLKLLAICLIPAVCEEITFRAFFQTILGRIYGKTTGLFMASLLFALAHNQLKFLHIYLLLGFIFGWLYYLTGSIWLPIICHFLNNAGTLAFHQLGFGYPLGLAFYLDVFVIIVAITLVAAGAQMIRHEFYNPDIKLDLR